MITLYTEEEFQKTKSNEKLELECIVCHKPFKKLKRVIQAVIRGDKGNSGNYCSKECISKSKQTGEIVECKNCKKIFYRVKSEINDNNFCSHSCSAKFNNKKRVMSKETKEKIRKKLEKIYENKCPSCEKTFKTHKKHKVFCSNECKKILNSLNKIKIPKENKYYIKRKKQEIERRGGYRERGGRCKQYEYINIYNEKMMLNKEEIILAAQLDLLKLDWCRNKKSFNYIDLEGKQRKYYPDFYIKNYNFYIEYKGWIIDKMIHKMKDAVNRNNIKLLIVYTNNKRFQHLGYNLQNIIEDPNSLIKKLT